uniref:Uncharacterized protein n=1 Tax=Anguilla anguilla TaxID=7936 RepID=A0A0E9Q301_ANGAN
MCGPSPGKDKDLFLLLTQIAYLDLFSFKS